MSTTQAEYACKRAQPHGHLNRIFQRWIKNWGYQPKHLAPPPDDYLAKRVKLIYRIAIAVWAVFLIAVFIIAVTHRGTNTQPDPTTYVAPTETAALPSSQPETDSTKLLVAKLTPILATDLAELPPALQLDSLVISPAEFKVLAAQYPIATAGPVALDPMVKEEPFVATEITKDAKFTLGPMAESQATEVYAAASTKPEPFDDTANFEALAPEIVTSDREMEADEDDYAKEYAELYALFDYDVKAVFCRMLYGEADDVREAAERAMCLCVVFNRYDTGIDWFGPTFTDIIKKSGQFTGYSASHPVTERNLAMLEVVIDQWIRMQLGESAEEVGWPLPRDILFWHAGRDAYAGHNRFYKLSRDALNGDRIYFDHTQPLADPYSHLEV